LEFWTRGRDLQVKGLDLIGGKNVAEYEKRREIFMLIGV